MQDENIRGWHKGLFGKQVQNSALGTLKRKLMLDPHVVVIDRFFPSTRMCPRCGAINEGITLSDRVFTCGCGYAEDRDVKAAETLLLAGKHIKSCTRAEHTGTPEERKSAGSQPSIPRMRYGSILRNALKRKEPGSSIFKRQLRWSSSPCQQKSSYGKE